ncbi:hypothetical protein [Flavobacterium sp.]|nr:hypothetical protein [Flavobacterium sp.]
MEKILKKNYNVEIFEINDNTNKRKALFEGVNLDFKLEKLD